MFPVNTANTLREVPRNIEFIHMFIDLVRNENSETMYAVISEKIRSEYFSVRT